MLRLLTAACALLSLLPAGASAYTINNFGTGELHWDQTLVFRDSDGRIPFWIQYQGADELSFVHESELRLGFLAWAQVAGADLHFYEQRADLRDAEFHAGTEAASDKKALLFYVEEDWPQDAFVIASTLVTFDATGRITDADIGFNADLYEFSMNDTPADVDLRSVATHEIGHFLGIGHSEFEDATMWATYEGGIGARTLSDDDIAAVEYLYPCGEMCRGIVDWRSRLDRSCSSAGRGEVGWFAGLAVLAWGLRRRASRRSRGGVSGPAVIGALALGLAMTLPAAVNDASSTLVERIDLARMTEASDVAVLATVSSVTPLHRGHVWSRIELDVSEYLRGAGPDRVVFEQPGGLLESPADDGTLGTLAFGYPGFTAGEQVVVFLAEHGVTGASHVVGLAQGKLSVAPGGRLERDLRDVALTTLPGRAPLTVSVPGTLSELRVALAR